MDEGHPCRRQEGGSEDVSLPMTLIVSPIGPSLEPFGITNNPALISATPFAPSNALESAVLLTLPPGAYTAIVSGAGGGTGVGMVEVFPVFPN